MCVFHSTMKSEKTKRYFRASFPRSCAQFLHRFLLCSYPWRSQLPRRRFDSNALLVSSSTAMTRPHRCLSQSSIDRSLLQLSSYPRMCRSIAQVCCICQASRTFLFALSRRHEKRKEIAGIYHEPRSSLWHLNACTFLLVFLPSRTNVHIHIYLYACNILLFICSYAADVKRRFVIFLHYSFLVLLGLSHSQCSTQKKKERRKLRSRLHTDEHVQTQFSPLLLVAIIVVNDCT